MPITTPKQAPGLPKRADAVDAADKRHLLLVNFRVTQSVRVYLEPDPKAWIV
jgi:hypothetical protein